MQTWLWVILLLAVVVVFVPTFTVEYGLHSDHLNLVDKSQVTPLDDGVTWSLRGDQLLSTKDLRRCCDYFVESAWLRSIGRGLNAWIDNVYFLLFKHIHDFSLGRLANALLLGLSTAMFYRHMVQRMLVPVPMAAALSMGIFLLPPALLYVTWLSQFIPGILPVFLSVLFYSWLDKINRYDMYILNKRFLFFGLFSIVFYIVLCFIYPPNAIFIIVYPLVRLLNVRRIGWDTAHFPIIRDLTVLGIVSALFFVLVKHVVKPMHGFLFSPHVFFVSDNSSQRYAYLLSTDPFDILEKLFKSMAFGAHLWFPSQGVAPVCILLLMAGVFAHYHTSKNTLHRHLELYRIFLIGLTILLAAAPVIGGRNAVIVGYRNSFTIMAMIAILTLWTVGYLGKTTLAMLHAGRPTWLFQRSPGAGRWLSGWAGRPLALSSIGSGVFIVILTWVAHGYVADTAYYFGHIEQPYLERLLPGKTDPGVQTVTLERRVPHTRVEPTERLCFYDHARRLRCLLQDEFSTLNSLVNHDLHLAVMTGNLLRKRDFGRAMTLKMADVDHFGTNQPGDTHWRVPLPTLTRIPDGVLLTLPSLFFW
ncbi:MAG: hypothetical protein HQL62_00265 [Magnetococcales bacterium]|nr:hypothetical protein [Magnetococcales bacterium]